jgi:LPS export ABC transporter protein LptC
MLFGTRLKKRVLGIIGLTLLGAVVHLLDTQRPEDIDLFSDVLDQPSEPDYYAVNSTYRTYDQDGHIVRSIQAERLLHFPDEQQTQLEAPLLITYDEQGRPLWHASSQRALIEGDGDHFQLNQNVIVWKSDLRSNSGQMNKSQLRLLTDILDFDLIQDIAYTRAPVRLESDQGIMLADGLNANLKTNQIKLLANVRGSYAQ